MIHLKVPVNLNQLTTLTAGDRVLLSGTVYTARDQAHIRLVNDSNPVFPLDNAVIYYVGPTPTKPHQIIGASGPTSSYRMDALSIPLMERGVKIMIGKGQRSAEFHKAMLKNNAVYLVTTGGAGALLSSKIKSHKVIMYPDLGAEAIHELVVKDFPCFVAYDLHGNSIFKGGTDQ